MLLRGKKPGHYTRVVHIGVVDTAVYVELVRDFFDFGLNSAVQNYRYIYSGLQQVFWVRVGRNVYEFVGALLGG